MIHYNKIEFDNLIYGNQEQFSILEILIFVAGYLLLATEIILLITDLYSPFKLDIFTYLKAFFIATTLIIGIGTILYYSKEAETEEDEDDVEQNQKGVKNKKFALLFFLITICSIGLVFISVILKPHTGYVFDLLRLTMSYLLISIALYLLYLHEKQTNRQQFNYFLTGNMLLATGTLLFVAEMIVILIRCIFSARDISDPLDSLMVIYHFLFINIYPSHEIYLEILLISAAIVISGATLFFYRKILIKNKIKDTKMENLEKEAVEMKKEIE